MPLKVVKNVRGFRKRFRGRKLNKRQIQEVKKIVGRRIEKKYHYVDIAGSISGGTTLALLTGVEMGTQSDQRIGQTITVTEINLRYSVAEPTSEFVPYVDHDPYNTCRVIVFKWLVDSDITTPTIGDILHIPSAAPSVFAHYNLEGASKYRICYDKTHTIGCIPVGVTSGGSIVADLASYSGSVKAAHVKIVGKRLHGKRVDLIGESPSDTDGYGHYYLLALSDSTFSPDPEIVGVSNVVFQDG